MTCIFSKLASKLVPNQSFKIFPQDLPLNFLQDFPQNFFLKISHSISRKISRKIFQQDFPTRISHRISHQISHRISHKISHRISHSISCKIFQQDFSKLDPDWLAPITLFQMLNFHQSLPFLSWLFPLHPVPQDFPARLIRKIFRSCMLIGWFPITLFQILNFHQSLLC